MVVQPFSAWVRAFLLEASGPVGPFVRGSRLVMQLVLCCVAGLSQAQPHPSGWPVQALEVTSLGSAVTTPQAAAKRASPDSGPTSTEPTLADAAAVFARLAAQPAAFSSQGINTAARRAVQVPIPGGDEVQWVLLSRPPGGATAAYLELPFALLDRVTLFWQSADGKLQMQRSGDRVAVDDWPVVGRYPAFDLTTANPADGRWLLALQHHAGTGVPLRLTDAKQLNAQHQLQGLLLGGGGGIFLLVIMLCVLQFSGTRDAAYGWYAVHATAMLLLVLAQTGLIGQYLLSQWPWLNNRTAAVLACLILVTASLFIRALLRDVSTPADDKWLQPLLLSFVAGGTLLASLQLFGSNGEFKIWISLLAPLTLVVLWLVVLWAGRRGNRAIRWVLLGNAPLLLGVSFPLLCNAGLMDVNFLSLYGIQLGVLVEVPAMYFALTLRHRERREQAVREQALNRNDPTTGLLIRELFTERVTACAARARRQGHTAWLVGVEVANLRRIEEAFDELVANKSLVVAAGVILKVAREVDETSRLTHNILALLVEGPLSEAAVQARAVEVVAAGLRVNPALPPGVRMQLRVTALAIPPWGQSGSDGTALVDALLAAAAANRGKRAVRVLSGLVPSPDAPTVPAELEPALP